VSSESRGHWLVAVQQCHTGHIGGERRALSCGVVGVGRSRRGWGGLFRGGDSREVWETGSEETREGTRKYWHGRGHGLGRMVGSWLEYCFLGAHQKQESYV